LNTIGYPYDYFTVVYFSNVNSGIVISGYAFSGYNGRLYKTINGGISWTYNNWNYPDLYYNSYFFNDSNFVLVGNRGLGFGLAVIYTNNIRKNILIPPVNGYMTEFVSTDWINSNTGYISGYDFGAGGGRGRVLKTTNNGDNWVDIYSTISSSVYNVKFFNENTGYITPDGLFSKTTNAGISWFQISTVGTSYDLNIITKDTFYICSYNGNVKISVDSGYTWLLRPVGYNVRFTSIRFINSKTGWACGDSGNIFRTDNAGINWQKQNSGTKALLRTISIIDQNNLWIGCDSGKILKTTNGGITFINYNENQISNSFMLFQNYPNPFNSTSKIKYQLKTENINKKFSVKIIVYDILGKEIIILVNDKKLPGIYEVNFNSNKLSSGIYFYALFADELKVDTKKLILLK
jgi:photosystem II stability/assembly factor-like uncharacterized protein